MTRTARQKRIRAERRAGLEPRPGCPHPNKRAYENETAVKVALRRSRASGRPLRIYTCECGSLHLTKQRQKRGEKWPGSTPMTKCTPTPK